MFYDRLKELTNPIDEERLKLDSVHQVKNTVYNFYKKKNQQCKHLLQELDKMTSERFHILGLKKKYFNAEEESLNQKSGALQNANERMSEIRMTASLNRLAVFK